MERQLIGASKRINDLACIARRLQATVTDLEKRLRFVEHAAKLKAGPR